jgi:hypothetical protein
VGQIQFSAVVDNWFGSRVRLLRSFVGGADDWSSLAAAMAGGLAKLPWSAWYLITSSMSGLWVGVGEEVLQGGVLLGEGAGLVVADGDGLRVAIEFSLMAHHPLRCLKVLTPGVKPWPPQEGL